MKSVGIVFAAALLALIAVWSLIITFCAYIFGGEYAEMGIISTAAFFICIGVIVWVLKQADQI